MDKRIWLYGWMGKKEKWQVSKWIDGRLAGWMHRWVANWIRRWRSRWIEVSR